MPRLTAQNPKYRRHKASGQAAVTLSGRQIYLGRYNSPESKTLYNKLVGEWRANNFTLPPSLGSGGPGMSQLIASYWAFAQEYYKPNPGKSAGDLWSVRMMLRVVKRLYIDTDVRQFTPLSLLACRDAMIREGRHRKWSRKYINAQIVRVRRMFKWGVERLGVPAETWQALKAVSPLREGKSDAPEGAPVEPIEDQVVEATLPFLGRRVAAMIRFQRLTGARPGEVVIMRGVDISTKEQPWEYRPPTHKTRHHGHERIIYIDRQAQEILRPLMKLDVNAYIFSPAEAEAERRAALHASRRTPLNCGNRPMRRDRKPRRRFREHYTVDSYRRAITRACDLADAWAKGGQVIANDQRIIRHWHPHQLRHTFGTEMRERHGVEVAQVLMGHKTLTAAQIYAKPAVQKARRALTKGA